jgi:hypothetical protein
MPKAISRVAISISPDGETLYAGVATIAKDNTSSLTANFLSQDHGDHWRPIALPAAIKGKDEEGKEVTCLALGQGDYNLAIQSDPSNPSTVYEALVGIYKSTDSGGSWKFSATGRIRIFTRSPSVARRSIPATTAASLSAMTAVTPGTAASIRA